MSHLLQHLASGHARDVDSLASIAASLDRLRVLMRMLPRRLTEQARLAQVARTSSSPALLSPLEQSFACHSNLMDRNALAHTFIAFLYPLFASLDGLLQQWLMHGPVSLSAQVAAAADSVYLRRNALWDALIGTTLKQ